MKTYVGVEEWLHQSSPGRYMEVSGRLDVLLFILGKEAPVSSGSEAACAPRNTVWTPQRTKQTLWPLVHKRTIPTDRLPLVDEI
jgi:hypothetical protein